MSFPGVSEHLNRELPTLRTKSCRASDAALSTKAYHKNAGAVGPGGETAVSGTGRGPTELALNDKGCEAQQPLVLRSGNHTVYVEKTGTLPNTN